MSRTWPAQSTGSTDEYETDNYSWPSDDSSYDDANDNGFYGGAASSASRIGGGAAAARTKGSGTKSSGGSGSGSRGGANNNLARAGSGSASSKATSSNSNTKRGGASTRKNPGTKSRDGDSDIELLSSDDDDSVVLPSSPKRRGSTRKAAAKAKKRIIDDSDDEYETDEEVVEKEKKSGGSGSDSRGGSRRSSRGGGGRRALRNINDNKSNAKGGKGKSNDSDYEDEEVEEDEDEEYIDDAESRLSWSPSKNKRRKVQSKDSDLSDGFDSSSDDSFDLGRNRSKALAKRRRKALNQGFSSSDEDSSSEDDDSKPKSKRKAPPSKASSARAAKPKSYLSSSSDSDSDDDVPSSKRKGPPAKSKPAKASKPSSIDSDSDSSIEFLATSPPPRKSPRRKAPSPAKKPSRRSLRRSTSSRGCSRKSPPESMQHDPSVRAATTKALEESRKAREALRAAQKYHAKEVELPDVEEAEPLPSGAARGSGGGGGARRAASVELVDVDSPPVALQKVPPAATRYSGPTIRLTLRYQHPSSNKECKSIVKIKMDQPLTHLQEEFKLQQNGKCEISVANFDGDKLDWVRTPNNYEMEDEDLVDVVVKLGSPRGSGRAGGGASQASDVYTIHVRPKGQAANSHTFKIKKVDPLSKLVTVYCQQHHFSEVRLEYNGRGLDPTKSLYEEGLPSVAHLDAVVMGETGVGGAAAGSGGGGGRPIQVKFRINGKSTSIETISVPFKSQFRSAMASFAEKRQVTVAQCKFIFDGEDLRPMDTPEGLDLEGGEIVDVVMPEKPAGNPVSSASVATKKPSAVRAAVESTNNSNSRARTSPRRARTSPRRARTSPRRATASPPANVPPAKISVKTNRNRNKAPKQKTWKLVDTDTLSKLKEDYVKLYKSKGCRSVKFYFENQLLQDVTKTFRELGIGEGDMMYAMENGKVYKPV